VTSRSPWTNDGGLGPLLNHLKLNETSLSQFCRDHKIGHLEHRIVNASN
jgi:hypothetical protein